MPIQRVPRYQLLLTVIFLTDPHFSSSVFQRSLLYHFLTCLSGAPKVHSSLNRGLFLPREGPRHDYLHRQVHRREQTAGRVWRQDLRNPTDLQRAEISCPFLPSS